MREVLSALCRRDILAGASALAFTPAAALGQIVQPVPESPAEPDQIASLAAGVNHDRLTIEVRINGAGPYAFIVDTGADTSVVSDRIAADLGLGGGHPVIVEGLVRRIPSVTVAVEELAFGPFRRIDLMLPVLPRAMLGCDGYLGLDVIDNTRVTFDFARKALKVEQPRDLVASNREGTARVPMLGREGYLRTGRCWIDGVQTTAFIDTGAEVSMGNPPLLAALRGKRRVPYSSERILLAGITGGEVEGQVVMVRHIRMDNLHFTDGNLAIVDVPNFASWQADTRPAFLMGMNFLRQFAAVAIDYRARELRFELARLDPLTGRYV